jgi:hypothetical protein
MRNLSSWLVLEGQDEFSMVGNGLNRRELANEEAMIDLSASLPCGCKKEKVLAGRCDTYDQNGLRRAEPEIQPMCRSNVRRLAAHFERRRSDAENQLVADTFEEAAASVWELLGGRIHEAAEHPIIAGERAWERMNERRCALIRKDVSDKGLPPEERAELAALESVGCARDALLTALANLRPKGLDALETAFANCAADGSLGLFTQMDDETGALCVDVVGKLRQKLLLGSLDAAESDLLLRIEERFDPHLKALLQVAKADA